MKSVVKNNYNIASRATQSNSAYVSVLQISTVLADGVSKSLRLKFLFSRERPLLACGYRDSAHYSQNEDKFPTFSLGLEFLNEVEKETKQRKRRLGISAVTIRFTVRG